MVCVVSNSENACTHFDFFPKNDECFSPDWIMMNSLFLRNKASI
jgi:hypothetical protein